MSQSIITLGLIVAVLIASPLRAQTKPTTAGVFRAPINGPLPTTPGDHKLRFRTKVGPHTIDMAFLLHLPDGYTPTGPKRPMLVFFHGLGECGTDLGAITRLGPMSKIEADPVFAHSCPLIVLSPQCPPRGQRWEDRDMNQAVVDLVHRVLLEMQADPDRVYATGLSMGGAGTWATAVYAPDVFAAISPISSIAWKPDLAAKGLTFVSIWNICGQNDGPRFLEGTQQMKLSLASDFADDCFTFLVGNAHDAWFPAYDSPTFYEWLLAHRRPTAAERDLLQHNQPCESWPLPGSRGLSLHRVATAVADQPCDLYYTLYTPKHYSPVGPPTALTLFLHEADVIGPDLAGLSPHGPNLALLQASDDSLADHVPMLIVSPRLPIKAAWDTPGVNAMLLGLIDHVAAEMNTDRTRITVTGLDAGAIAAANLARQNPGVFAAVAPVLSAAFPDTPATDTPLPGNLYTPDATIAERLIRTPLAPTWHVTRTPDAAAFTNPAFYHWLAAQHRATPTTVTTAGSESIDLANRSNLLKMPAPIDQRSASGR